MFTNHSYMDSILAPSSDGTFETLFGINNSGLFLQRLQTHRYVYRHTASGLSLFCATGNEKCARNLQNELIEKYDFQRDSTWVLKSLGELHSLLRQMGLKRHWLQRAWHYDLESSAAHLASWAGH